MPTIDAHPVGRFCWIELGTTDLEKAKPFYAEIFGWDSKEEPAGEMGTYTMFTKGEHEVAGAYTQPPEMVAAGVPPNWMPYVNVASVDETLERAKALGATNPMGPLDVMDIGRMAFFQDPVGATIALWQAKSHRGPSLVYEPGCPNWYEGMSKDVAKSVAFYTELFGWTSEVKPVTTGDGDTIEYHVYKQGDDQVGGTMQMGPEFGPVPSHWTVYVQVEDLDVAHGKVEGLGGKTVVPPMPIPDVGRFCQVTDPTGAHLALIEMAPGDC